MNFICQRCGASREAAPSRRLRFCSAACSASHGHASSRKETTEYRCWSAIKKRCFNPRHRQFRHYGGRGITMHPSWAHDFAAFLAEVGNRPSPQHVLDRIDNDRGYEPGNVRWTTPTVNNRNKRNNHKLTAFGRTQLLIEWSEETGIDRGTIWSRLRAGLSAEDALTRPVRCCGRRRRAALPGGQELPR